MTEETTTTEAPTAKKTPAKKKATKKKATAKKKAAPKKEASNRFEAVVEDIRANLAEARQALTESGSVIDDRRKEIALSLIANMQENTDATLSTLEDVVKSESLNETLQISRDALRSGIERNVRQVRDFADFATTSTKETAAPVGDYLSSLRAKIRENAA